MYPLYIHIVVQKQWIRNMVDFKFQQKKNLRCSLKHFSVTMLHMHKCYTLICITPYFSFYITTPTA